MPWTDKVQFAEREKPKGNYCPIKKILRVYPSYGSNSNVIFYRKLCLGFSCADRDSMVFGSYDS